MKTARLVVLLLASLAGASAASFGTNYPLLGEFSDLALDESRGVVYLANLTANRIDVFSLASRTLQAPIKLGINPSTIALSPDGTTLLIGNFSSDSLFQVNLTTRAVKTIALPPPPPPLPAPCAPGVPDCPRAVAFGSDGKALIATTVQLLLYDPATGDILNAPSECTFAAGSLPVPQPTFPAEIVNARMAVTKDRSTIFVVGTAGTNSYFAFYYSVPPAGTLVGTITCRCSSVVQLPVQFDSIAPDGSKMMGGSTLFDRQLRVLADFVPSGILPIKVAPANPTAPPPNTPPPSEAMVVGATVFSSDGSKIYANIAEGATGANPFLYVLDSDNLTIRDQILLPAHLTGKMISDAAGNNLYAVSDSGLAILPISTLNSAPQITTNTDTIVFHFNVCNTMPGTATFTIANAGSGSVDFRISSSMAGLSFSQTGGTTPATITAFFDPSQLFNVVGTTLGTITVTSRGAVNIPGPVRVLANLQDSDQRGTVFVQDGQLRDLLIDQPRQRFYILDSEFNRLLVFSLKDYSLVQTVRTGYFPFQMSIGPDQKTLLVVNAQSETISQINLDTLTSEGFIYCTCSNYPRSIAVSTNKTLVTTATDRSEVLQTANNGSVQVVVTHGMMNYIDYQLGVCVQPPTKGVPPPNSIFTNDLSPKSLMVSTPSGSQILVAEDVPGAGSSAPGGVADIYDAESDTFIVSRAISSNSLLGSAAATDTSLYSAGAVVMSTDLVPVAEFSDAPNLHNALVFVGSQMVRTLRPATGGGAGIVERVDPNTFVSANPVKLTEAPLPLTTDQPLRRTLAGTSDGSTFITLTSSGFEVIPGNFDAFVQPAVISSVTNSANFSSGVAPGALISVFGNNLSPVTTSATEVPLPTFLADTCLTVNNLPVPLLYLSSGQVNAQLPFEVSGSATMIAHTPGGVSAPFGFQVLSAAPALFSYTYGGLLPAGVPIVIRAANGQPVTNSNPVHQGDVLMMFANGLGAVTPQLADGYAAPLGSLFSAVQTPSVTLGGSPAQVLFSGLAPGFVGLNQINVQVAANTPSGFNIPLEISSGGVSAQTVLVRVESVEP